MGRTGGDVSEVGHGTEKKNGATAWNTGVGFPR